MPDNDVWPPKPDLPDPITEYDEVIAAKLAALSETKAGPSRLLLTKALREEKGLDLRQAYASVTNYCDRHDILVRPKTSPTMAWLGCLGPLSLICCAGLYLYFAYQRDAILSLPHYHSTFLALNKERLAVDYALIAVALLNIIISSMRFGSRRRK